MYQLGEHDGRLVETQRMVEQVFDAEGSDEVFVELLPDAESGEVSAELSLDVGYVMFQDQWVWAMLVECSRDVDSELGSVYLVASQRNQKFHPAIHCLH